MLNIYMHVCVQLYTKINVVVHSANYFPLWGNGHPRAGEVGVGESLD